MNTSDCNHDYKLKRFDYERDGLDWWKVEINICNICGHVNRKIVKSESGIISPAWFNG